MSFADSKSVVKALFDYMEVCIMNFLASLLIQDNRKLGLLEVVKLPLYYTI